MAYSALEPPCRYHFFSTICLLPGRTSRATIIYYQRKRQKECVQSIANVVHFYDNTPILAGSKGTCQYKVKCWSRIEHISELCKRQAIFSGHFGHKNTTYVKK